MVKEESGKCSGCKKRQLLAQFSEGNEERDRMTDVVQKKSCLGQTKRPRTRRSAGPDANASLDERERWAKGQQALGSDKGREDTTGRSRGSHSGGKAASGQPGRATESTGTRAGVARGWEERGALQRNVHCLELSGRERLPPDRRVTG